MIVVATKLDATTNRDHRDELRDFAAERGLEFHAVSSASGEGIPELVRAFADALDRLPKTAPPAAPAPAPYAGRMAPESAGLKREEDADTDPRIDSGGEDDGGYQDRPTALPRPGKT
jgi:hypothetical protein